MILGSTSIQKYKYIDFKWVFSTKNGKNRKNTGKTGKTGSGKYCFMFQSCIGIVLWCVEKDPVAYVAPSGQQIVLLYPLMLTWPGMSLGETKI